MANKKYKVLPGPEAYLAPAAALMGAVLPDNGGIVEGEAVSEDAAIEAAAQKLVSAKNAAVCPGPMLLWQWDDGASAKADAVRAMAEACGARIVPMIDYSARRIFQDREISPNHPNATILHNDIDVCLFVGIHYHYVNFALRLIRGRTDCYTIALCDYAPSDEAAVSVGGVDAGKIEAITGKIKAFKINGL